METYTSDMGTPIWKTLKLTPYCMCQGPTVIRESGTAHIQAASEHKFPHSSGSAIY